MKYLMLHLFASALAMVFSTAAAQGTLIYERDHIQRGDSFHFHWLPDSILICDKAILGVPAGLDTFQVKNGVWYQTINGKRSLFFSQAAFRNSQTTCYYTQMDTIIDPGYLYYSLKPYLHYQKPGPKQAEVFVFILYMQFKRHEKRFGWLYFDPEVGMIGIKYEGGGCFLVHSLRSEPDAMTIPYDWFFPKPNGPF